MPFAILLTAGVLHGLGLVGNWWIGLVALAFTLWVRFEPNEDD